MKWDNLSDIRRTIGEKYNISKQFEKCNFFLLIQKQVYPDIDKTFVQNNNLEMSLMNCFLFLDKCDNPFNTFSAHIFHRLQLLQEASEKSVKFVTQI